MSIVTLGKEQVAENSHVHFGAGAVACTICACLLGFRALGATIYYVPSETPFLWTDACWFTNSEGTVACSAPGASDIAYLGGDLLKDGTLTIPSGTAASVDSVQARQSGMTLEVGDGASLTFGHSTTFGKTSNTCLHILKGGALTATSYFYVSDSNRSNVRVLVDEGGSASFNNPLYIGYTASGAATSTYRTYLENHGDVYIAKAMVRVGCSYGKGISAGFIDNHGTIRTASSGSNYIQLGATAGDKGYFTNRVDATANLNMGLLVGTGTNGTGYVVNHGTMTLTKAIYIGGDNVASERDDITSATAAVGTFENRGTLTSSGTLTLGGHKYGNGTFRNYGAMTIGGKVILADRQNAKGNFTTYSGSTTMFNGSLTVAYYGKATLTLNGSTYVTNAAINVACEKGSSSGTVNLTSGGRLYGNRKGLNIVSDPVSATGSVNLSGTSKYDKPGVIQMGAGKSSVAELILTESSVLNSPSLMVVGIGATAAVDAKQRATLSLSGTSQITDMRGNLYVATNSFGRGEVVVADSASIVFSPTAKRSIYLANKSTNAVATLHLRGGSVTMTTNCLLCVGRTSPSMGVCNGFVKGWGRFYRHSPELTSYDKGANLYLYNGAITADGEGVDRDLDLSWFRKIDENSTPATNLSGTNGWYAVNGGRLTYPCHSSGYRMLGDYYSRAGDPVYVNGVSIDCEGRDGYLIGQLYATDRTDIPAGLPQDNPAGIVKRLGVWRATINSTYDATNVTAKTRGSVTSAAIKVRYNNFLLNELAGEGGAFDAEQTLVLYSHDGSASGSWRRVKTVSAATAEAEGHLIGGTIKASPEPWNLGFFAVVAERKRGLALILR